MVNWKNLLKKIPSHIQVTKKARYEVVWTDGFLDPNVMGETRFDPNQIVIKNNLSPKETVTTYIHEVIHAISNEYDVGLTETQVRALEKSLYYVLKNDNMLKEGKK